MALRDQLGDGSQAIVRRWLHSWPMITKEVHFLVLHEPYTSPEHPVPINATIVHALTLLHPKVPQPDGGMIFRCLTEFPGRTPGCVVPLSTLTFELNGGQLWSQVGNWEAVADAVSWLARERYCDAMPLGLGPRAETLLAHGPNTEVTFYSNGRKEVAGEHERQEELDNLTLRVREFVARGPFFAGENLVKPPKRPRTMPYHPTHRPAWRVASSDADARWELPDVTSFA